MKIFFSVLLLISGTFYTATAQKIVTDRPDQTESSTTIPFKSFQIESGFLTGSTSSSGITEKGLLIPTTLFRFGMTENLELRVAEQVERVKNELASDSYFGFGDLELGVKIQVLKREDINTEIAFLSHLIIPTGSEGLSNEKVGIVNKVAVSHSLNDLLGVGYNLGYNYLGVGKGDVTYSWVLGIAISDKIGGYAELYGEFADIKELYSKFDMGLTYLVKDNFQLDLSGGAGLNHKMQYISIGFSWNISSKMI